MKATPSLLETILEDQRTGIRKETACWMLNSRRKYILKRGSWDPDKFWRDIN